MTLTRYALFLWLAYTLIMQLLIAYKQMVIISRFCLNKMFLAQYLVFGSLNMFAHVWMAMVPKKYLLELNFSLLPSCIFDHDFIGGRPILNAVLFYWTQVSLV